MIPLHQTSEAMAELAASRHFGVGDHRHDNVRSGVPGQLLGYVSFDPSRHLALDIDPLAGEGFIGEAQVAQVLPDLPLNVNIITAYPAGIQEHPAVLATKQALKTDLADALGTAVPHMTDRTYLYSVGQDIPDDGARNSIKIEAATDDELFAECNDLAQTGLTFVIGGFATTRLLEQGESAHRLEAVAIKVDHPANRRLPAGVGYISLGGLVEVNTNNPPQLKAVNNRLAQRHEDAVDALVRMGADVVSVVAQPGRTTLYDRGATDVALASAVRRQV